MNGALVRPFSCVCCMTNVGIIISAKQNAEGGGEIGTGVPHKSQFNPFSRFDGYLRGNIRIFSLNYSSRHLSK